MAVQVVSSSDLYPATALQQGMLFQSMLAQGAGIYLDQFAWVGGFSSAVPAKDAIAGALENPKAANQKLSLARANAVKQYLVDKGINAARITTKGLGPDNPIASNKTKEGRQKNRRIEFYRVK